ncbi:hypothetical protein [Streptomyces sp. HNM0574]|uniref:hypothetical protein n=1 Tax=Streptomyces sp. HNM0574 TaxID=2714954 RepID=UPI00146C3263|nr:hypothetical protein [Streptomyces sp. HNM0574]NLU70964.1 hypothetical protein [Streptomyces sp. HNM0574]
MTTQLSPSPAGDADSTDTPDDVAAHPPHRDRPDEVTEAEWVLAMVFLVPSFLLLQFVNRHGWNVSLAWITWTIGTALLVWGWTRLIRTRGRGASGWLMFLAAHGSALFSLTQLLGV